ncbi:hypothetical protein EDD15DRAFT_2192546 [Pisolithus albus]|nr:hypothetical protein EDD15DRAFT_2192546 [Pisolithus albus]
MAQLRLGIKTNRPLTGSTALMKTDYPNVVVRCLGTIGREHRPSRTRVAKWFIPVLMAMTMSASEQQPIITSATTFRFKLDLAVKAASGRPSAMMKFTRMYSDIVVFPWG